MRFYQGLLARPAHLRQCVRAAAAAAVGVDAGPGTGGPLVLQGSKAGLHTEEQEDGEERPDLDCTLSVTAAARTSQAAA